MPNTYTQIRIHFVFAVKYRQALINEEWEDNLHRYITGLIHKNNHKLIAINSAYDHIHILIGLNPNQSISELMRLVKSDSSEWINKNNLTPRKFQWQEGYGAFSHSKSQTDAVVKYILNQKEHHKKGSFRDEYLKILQDFEVEFDAKYVFHELLED
jgi:REP element-mobilizing transposase RayT